jgi:hypothetical protein
MTQLHDTRFSEPTITVSFRAIDQSLYSVLFLINNFESEYDSVSSPNTGEWCSSGGQSDGIQSRVCHPALCYFYVRVFALYHQSQSLAAMERQLQLSMNGLWFWSQESSFDFQLWRSHVHFCRLGGIFIIFSCFRMTIDNFWIDIWIYWTFIQLMTMLHRPVSHRLVFSVKFQCLLCSHLDYGSFIYAAVSKALSFIEPSRHSGMHLSAGALRTARVEGLYVESEEPVLAIQW